MTRLPPQPWMTAASTRAVVDALQADGRAVRFVGGCVRDALLGRRVHDIDIATPDPPDTVIALLARAGLKAVPTGISHGTVTAVAHGQPFEITTLREDVRTDGRHAEVAFTDSWEADAARRDFTINAMSSAPDGRLYDPFNGRRDLARGRVAFVGNPDRRVREDYLRVLRFFRFHARFGRGGPDALGLRAATALAPELTRLPGERIRDELTKLLAVGDPGRTVAVMVSLRVLAPIVPGLAAAATLRALIAREHRHAVAPDAERRLAALHRRGDDAAATAERVRLSKAARARLTALVPAGAGVAADGPASALNAALYREGAERARDRVLLDAARRDASGTAPTDRAVDAALARVAAWTSVRLPISGADVKAAGVPPGPRVGEVVRAVESWWIERGFQPDRDACLAKLTAVVESGEA